jgi:hypothetical protein
LLNTAGEQGCQDAGCREHTGQLIWGAAAQAKGVGTFDLQVS